jgi:CRP/FNR family transcriptional regulator, cyclic AMP receptor protein
MKAVREPASLPLFHSELGLARLRRSVRGSVRAFASRAPLARHGQPLGAVHVVLSGLVSLTSTSDGGRQATLALIGPGGVLGQESVLSISGVLESSPFGPLDLETPQVDAVAFVPCTTLVLPASELREALGRDPLIAAWLAASLGQRVRGLERGLIRSLSFPVRERVLDVLLEVASTYGERRPWGVIVKLPLSQDDIAALVGATRESVNRALRQLEISGAVCRVDRAYAVRDRNVDQGAESGVS